MSVQCAAVASQKFTCPGLILAPPAVTAAVSVTTVPVATELTTLPSALMEIEVAVAAFVWAEAALQKAIPAKRNAAQAWRASLGSIWQASANPKESKIQWHQPEFLQGDMRQLRT